VTGKNGSVLFDRPKPTAGCSANGGRSAFYIKTVDLCSLMHLYDAVGKSDN
jgi:hypothetical protein